MDDSFFTDQPTIWCMKCQGRREFTMWKKTLPLFVLSGILLVGCTNKSEIPEDNETPIEDIRDDTRDNTDANQKENNIYDAEIDENGDKSQVEIIEDFNRKNDVE